MVKKELIIGKIEQLTQFVQTPNNFPRIQDCQIIISKSLREIELEKEVKRLKENLKKLKLFLNTIDLQP